MTEIALGIRLTGDNSGLVGTVQVSTEHIEKFGFKTKQAAEVATTGLDKTSKSALIAAREFSKLEGEIDPVVASSKKLISATDILDREYKAGNITIERHAKLMELANNRYKQGRKGMVNMRMASQQLGYQVQDMAVQMQMGVSPIVALTQQGSQLVSVLGPSGALFGAVLAIGGAISGAFVSSLTSASKELDEFEARYESMVSSLESVQIREAAADIKLFEQKAEETEKIYNTAMSRRQRVISIYDRMLDSEYELTQKEKANAQELASIRESAYNNMVDAQAALAEAQSKLRDLRKNDEDKEEDKRVDSVHKFIEALEDEAATLGFNSIQLSVYRAEKLKMNEAELETVRTLAQSIEQHKALADAEEQRLKRITEANKKYQQSYQASMNKGQALTVSMMTATERYEHKLDQLFDLYGQGAITIETFNRAQIAYQQEMTKTDSIEDFSDSFIQHLDRIESASARGASAFKQTWLDAAIDAEINVKNFLKSIAEEIASMHYDLTIGNAVNSWMNALFGSFGTASQYGTNPGSQQTQQLQEQELGLRGAPVPAVAGRAAVNTVPVTASGGGSVVVNNYNDFSNVSSADQSWILEAIAENGRQTQARVFQLMNRGGQASLAAGRR